MCRHHALVVIACLPGTVSTAGEVVQFIPIPGAVSVGDITPDGSVIVGTGSGGYYWRWQEDPMPVLIGGTSAVGVSDDGTIIIGTIDDPDTGAQIAGIWNEKDGWESLGGFSQCGSISSAYDITGDGSTVVGLAWDGCNGRGFRWTAETGMELLENLGNGVNRASVISDDGQVIGGFAQGTFNRTPARWSADSTGTLWDAGVVGEVGALNADGSRIMGSYNGRAFTWTEEEGVVALGEISPAWTGRVLGTNADSSLMVGFEFSGLNRDAMIWNGAGQIARLQQVLLDLGLPSVPALHVAVDISADSRTIIGHTTFQGAWIVHFPELCPADLDGDGAVGFSDLLAVITAWGPCPGCPEDLDGNDAVEFADLLVILTEWGPCP